MYLRIRVDVPHYVSKIWLFWISGPLSLLVRCLRVCCRAPIRSVRYAMPLNGVYVDNIANFLEVCLIRLSA